MIQVEIEKEIRQENKVFWNFNARQTACLCGALGFSVVCAAVFGLEFSLALYPCLAAGACCFVFGWGKLDGLPMERVLAKKLEAALYKNSTRACRTKNAYIALLNGEYERRREMDRKDRGARRQVRRECRIRKSRRRRSRYRVVL